MEPKMVRQLVDVQKRAVRRGGRFWIDAAERLQMGDLRPAIWIDAYAQYLRGLGGDAADALAVLRGKPAAPGGEQEGRDG